MAEAQWSGGRARVVRADLRAPRPLRGGTSARGCDLVLPPGPQSDGYTDADGDDDDQSDCEANEKAAHG